MQSKKGLIKKAVVTSNQITFDNETVALIKNTVAKGASENEFQMFIYQAQKTGLDPLARQIYFVARGQGDKRQVTIQTSIDGLRLVAQRSGDYAGQDEPRFENAQSGKPLKATITVYKFGPSGERYPAAVGVAYWDEYKPGAGQDFMWNKMPHTMLGKVAEALALRKAFPQELSGLYTTEEMDQAGNTSTLDGNAKTATPAKPSDNSTVKVEEGQVVDDDFNFSATLKEVNGTDNLKKLTEIFKTVKAVVPQTTNTAKMIEIITKKGTILRKNAPKQTPVADETIPH